MDKDERKKLSVCVEESWKTRENYIKDYKTKYSNLYNIWRSNCSSGNSNLMQKSWGSFKQFCDIIAPQLTDGLVVKKKQCRKPLTMDNYRVMKESDFSKQRYLNKFVTYDGVKMNLVEIAQKYDLNIESLYERYRKHKNEYTAKELIFGKKRPTGITATDYRKFDGSIIRKARNMLNSYKTTDLKKGFGENNLTAKWLIDNIITSKCVYCGDDQRVGCDRIDNTKGHTKENVVPCCYECNCARNSNFSYREMLVIGKVIKEVKQQRKGVL